MAKERTTTYLEKGLLKKVKLAAVERETSVTAIMEEALIAWLRKHRQPAHEMEEDVG